MNTGMRFWDGMMVDGVKISLSALASPRRCIAGTNTKLDVCGNTNFSKIIMPVRASGGRIKVNNRHRDGALRVIGVNLSRF